MGLQKMFDENLADFRRLSSERFYVGDVIHEAVVKVDEEKTEAAAATGILIILLCLLCLRRR